MYTQIYLSLKKHIVAESVMPAITLIVSSATELFCVFLQIMLINTTHSKIYRKQSVVHLGDTYSFHEI